MHNYTWQNNNRHNKCIITRAFDPGHDGEMKWLVGLPRIVGSIIVSAMTADRGCNEDAMSIYIRLLNVNHYEWAICQIITFYLLWARVVGNLCMRYILHHIYINSLHHAQLCGGWKPMWPYRSTLPHPHPHPHFAFGLLTTTNTDLCVIRPEMGGGGGGITV